MKCCLASHLLLVIRITTQLPPDKTFDTDMERSPRVAELGSLSSEAKMAMKIFVKRVFTIFATNASFLREIKKFANLTQ